METMAEYRERQAKRKDLPLENKERAKSSRTEYRITIKCRSCPYMCEKCKDLDDFYTNNYHHVKDTLCWCCAKSTINGCSWMAKKIPVEGWKAEERIIFNNGIKINSYNVMTCPGFVRG